MRRKVRLVWYDLFYYLGLLSLGVMLLFGVHFVWRYFNRFTTQYDIELSGKLYVVNKGNSSMSIVSLKSGAEQSVPLHSESHEIGELKEHGILVIPNFGDEIMGGDVVQLFNHQTQEFEPDIILEDKDKPHGVYCSKNHIYVALERTQRLLAYNYKEKSRRYFFKKGFHPHLVRGFKSYLVLVDPRSDEVLVVDNRSLKVLYSIPVKEGIGGIEIDQRGRLWLANSIDNSMEVVDLISGHPLKKDIPITSPLRIAIHPSSGDCYVVTGKGGGFSVIDGKNYKKRYHYEFPGKEGVYQRALHHTPRIVQLHFEEEGKFLFLSNSNAGKVEVINCVSREHVASIKVGDIPDGLWIVH